MPRARTGLIFAGVFVAAAGCINLSWIHTKHDADSLLTSLISIERWTPYYWGDNRFGTLVPLLAAAVRSYVPNLLLQTQLSICAALLTVVLFQCFFLDRERGFTARNLSSACLTAVLAMLVFRPHDRVVQVFLLPSHPYFTSLSLALIGLIALIRYAGRPLLRYSVAVIALLLSFWVNWTNGPVIAGLALLLPSGAKSPVEHLRARAPALLLICAAFAAMYAFSLRYPRVMITGLAPLSEVPITASRMWTNVVADMLYPARAAVVSGGALVAAAVRWRTAVVRKLFFPGEAHVIIVIALVFAISVATSEWVMKNAYEWRYWTVPAALIFLVVASFVADSIYLLIWQTTSARRADESVYPTQERNRKPPERRLQPGLAAPQAESTSSWNGKLTRCNTINRFRAAGVIAVLFFAASIVRAFGVPSLARARAGIESVSRVHYAKVEQLRCTHMIGDYWIAWSSVFYNRSHNIQPPLWAVSMRSEVTEHLWSKTPPGERRYCGVCGDPMINYNIIVFKLGPLRHMGQADDICLFQK